MASALTIKSSIDSILIKNGNKRITGPILHDIVKSILDVDIRATGKITDHINSPQQGTISANFFVRKFYDSAGNLSVDYGNRKLYRTDGSYFDWNGGVGSGTVTSVELSSTDFLITADNNPIVSDGSFTIDLNDGAVTYDKIQDVSAGPILLGRWSPSTGVVQEIIVGSGFDLDTATGVLSANLVVSAQINLAAHSIDANTIGTTVLATTQSGHGSFIPTRLVWITKTSTVSSGPISEALFSVTWSGGSILPTTGAPSLLTINTVDFTRWADFTQVQKAIPANTAISINILTASTGYSSHDVDVYLVGFYES